MSDLKTMTMKTKLFVSAVRDVLTDFDDNKIDSTELRDQIESLIEYFEL